VRSALGWSLVGLAVVLPILAVILAPWASRRLPEWWFVDDRPSERPYWANRSTLYLRSNRRNFITVCWMFTGVAASMCLFIGVGLIQNPA